MLLENRVSVVTGGASGIGRETAAEFVKQGPVVVDDNEDGGTEIVGMIETALADGNGSISKSSIRFQMRLL